MLFPAVDSDAIKNLNAQIDWLCERLAKNLGTCPSDDTCKCCPGFCADHWREVSKKAVSNLQGE